LAQGVQQTSGIRVGYLARRLGRIEPRSPQEFIDDEIPDSGNPLLVQQPCLQSDMPDQHSISKLI
jgi:hypothetical protein